jgi:hypothetical protein
MTNYPIVLTAGARVAMRETERRQLAHAMQRESFERDGSEVAPYALIKPAGSPVGYPARALSSGHVAVFRPEPDHLRRSRRRGRAVGRKT